MPYHLIIATCLVPIIIQKKSPIRLFFAIVLLIYFSVFATVKIMNLI